MSGNTNNYLAGLGDRFARRAEHALTVALYIGDRINRKPPTGLNGTPFQQLHRDLEEMNQIARQLEEHYLNAAFEPEFVPEGATVDARYRSITAMILPDDPAELADALRSAIRRANTMASGT